MSKKTYKTGTFAYPVVRPNVKAFEAFKGKKFDAKSLTELLDHMALFARGVNPKLRVLWQENIATDHSKTEQDGTWTVRANPLRMTRKSQLDASSPDPGTMTMDGLASTAGALLHEVAHTVYSPETNGALLKVTQDERAVLGIYEDLYVNTQLLKSRLPGLVNLLPHAYNWSNPRDLLTEHVNNPTGQAGWFSEALSVISGDFIAFINGKKACDFPLEWQAELAERVRPIRDRLASDKPLSWDKRYTLIKRAVKIAYGVLHKHGLYDPPPPPAPGEGEEGEGGGEGEAQGTAAGGQSETGQQQSQSGSGDGDGEDVSGIGDDSGLEDVVPKQPKDKGYGCEQGEQEESQSQKIRQANQRRFAPPSALEKAVAAANAIAEAKAQGGSNDPGDYGEVDGCYIVPANEDYSTDHYNKERANQLRRVFRTFSNTRRGWLHGTDAGKLSARRLPGLVSGTTRNVFKARTEIRGAQGAVLILIDGSGSMGGKPYEQAALAARELFEAIGHNPDYKVYAWAYSGGGAQVDVISARYMNGKLYWPRCEGGSTPSWAAMVNGAKFLKRKHPNKKRVIVHLTDLGWNDSFIADFTTHVEQDVDLDYITIGIDNGYGSSARGLDNQRMRVSRFSANGDIVGAVQEFAKKAFRG